MLAETKSFEHNAGTQVTRIAGANATLYANAKAFNDSKHPATSAAATGSNRLFVNHKSAQSTWTLKFSPNVYTD